MKFGLPPRSQTPFGNALAEATPLPIFSGHRRDLADACRSNKIAPTIAFPNGVWERGKAYFVPIASAFAFTLIGTSMVTADSGTENEFKPWPALVAEDLRAPAVTKHFQITTTPANDQTGAGTGGAVIDIDVRRLSSGKLLRIEAQCVGLRVLESYNGFPQLEIWHHYGDGAYSRTLFRVEHGKYAAIREDSFDRNINDAARKDIIASLPGGEGPLYFTGTGPGDWYQPDENQ